MRSHPHLSAPSVKQHGFSMLEVLITLVIIAIALLGTAGLQLYAMRMGQGGQYRTQAIFLASDITERMEANKAEAVLGSYAVAATSAVGAAATLCDGAACSSPQLAAWDINQWGTNLTNVLPQPSWQICIDADSNAVCDPVPVAANPITYRIVISWTDRSNVKTISSANALPDSYAATRTISTGN